MDNLAGCGAKSPCLRVGTTNVASTLESRSRRGARLALERIDSPIDMPLYLLLISLLSYLMGKYHVSTQKPVQLHEKQWRWWTGKTCPRWFDAIPEIDFQRVDQFEGSKCGLGSNYCFRDSFLVAFLVAIEWRRSYQQLKSYKIIEITLIKKNITVFKI